MVQGGAVIDQAFVSLPEVISCYSPHRQHHCCTLLNRHGICIDILLLELSEVFWKHSEEQHSNVLKPKYLTLIFQMQMHAGLIQSVQTELMLR